MEIPKEVIEHCALFVQMPTERVYELLDELCAGTRTYACGEALVLAGYENSSIGIVLEGRIEAYKSEPDQAVCLAMSSAEATAKKAR